MSAFLFALCLAMKALALGSALAGSVWVSFRLADMSRRRFGGDWDAAVFTVSLVTQIVFIVSLVVKLLADA